MPDITVDEVTFPHLSAEERGQLQSCLQEYAGLFANGDLDLGSTDVVMHTIDTGYHPAIRQPPHRIPFALRSHMEKMIRQMEEQKVIQPSKSLWASWLPRKAGQAVSVWIIANSTQSLKWMFTPFHG